MKEESNGCNVWVDSFIGYFYATFKLFAMRTATRHRLGVSVERATTYRSNYVQLNNK